MKKQDNLNDIRAKALKLSNDAKLMRDQAEKLDGMGILDVAAGLQAHASDLEALALSFTQSVDALDRSPAEDKAQALADCLNDEFAKSDEFTRAVAVYQSSEKQRVALDAKLAKLNEQLVTLRAESNKLMAPLTMLQEEGIAWARAQGLAVDSVAVSINATDEGMIFVTRAIGKSRGDGNGGPRKVPTHFRVRAEVGGESFTGTLSEVMGRPAVKVDGKVRPGTAPCALIDHLTTLSSQTVNGSGRKSTFKNLQYSRSFRQYCNNESRSFTFGGVKFTEVPA